MKPNMTLRQLNRWTNSQAFREYRRDHNPAQVAEVLKRTRQYLQGNATPAEEQKVENFISRHSAQEAGRRVYGAGSARVSAQTAALRNWGYDPTGRYS